MAVFVEKVVAILMSVLFSLAVLFGIASEKQVKNVILLIGDGMGENHLAMTEDMRDRSLVINKLPQFGYAKTYCANKPVTDSAAGATALACGVKTSKGTVGMYWENDEATENPSESYPANITEVCIKNGMKTGVITSDELSGATPGGFTAHTESRNNHEEITRQQIVSGIDIIWGKADGTVTEEQVTQAGYVYIDTLDEMRALTGDEQSYGMFKNSLYHTYNKGDSPTLSQMTSKAIELLDTDNENGFFLMVEGAHIDKKSHNEDEEGAAEALEEFDYCVEIALNFAKKDGHTLVVVTADHETGGVTLNENGVYEMTTGGHTAANVPVRAYGPVEFIKNGTVIENTDIPKRIYAALELPAGAFPCSVLKKDPLTP